MTDRLHGLRLLLADDHIAVRDSIKELLLQAGVNVIGEAADGIEAVRLCRETMPDVAVLDISMPRMNGIDAARELRRSNPHISIVLLTMHSPEIYLRAALNAGANEFVLKTKAVSCLLDAISSAINHQVFRAAGTGRG
jgi:DNA-binding NarL/FixJ family response regulator